MSKLSDRITLILEWLDEEVMSWEAAGFDEYASQLRKTYEVVCALSHKCAALSPNPGGEG